MEIVFIGNKTFYYLLKEVTEHEIFHMENFEELYKINNSFIFILDGENLTNYSKLKELKKLKKIIIFINKIDVDFLNYLLINEIKFDAYKKEKYIFISDYINGDEEKETKKIIVSDLIADAYIDINDILYISYDRQIKKSFVKTQDDIFYSRKTLSEIEEEFKSIKIFQRVERSFILNMEKILYINFKEEYIKFENKNIIYIGKRKLREISEKMSGAIKKI